ncbi:MAG TPA: tetratricopeptide repeat protein [Rhodanobacteraceae bacterium]|nr:tetratricopeptide repeat protein [Rhodanobacteraceae bacterium]
MVHVIQSRSIAALCGSLLTLCAAAAEPPAVPAQASSVATPISRTNDSGSVAPVPVIAATAGDAAIAAQWNQILEHGDFKQVIGTYALVTKLETANDGVKADACSANADALEAALKINPVGLALWYDAYQCAKALNQADLAEQRLRSFTNLVGFALRSKPPDWGDTPIRVLHFDDVVAFIQASGEKVLNLYVDRIAGSRYLPVTVVLSDSTHHRVQILTFDFLDAAMRMARDPNAQFPKVRNLVAGEILEALAQSTNGQGPFAQALHLGDAMTKADLKSRVQALNSLAASGNYVAALRLATICLFGKSGNCGAEAVDALLPWAEKHDPEAMLWLAFAYADGNGVRINVTDARRLIEAADHETGDIRMACTFASLREGGSTEVDPVVRPIIEAQAREGEPHAQFVIAETAANAYFKRSLSPAVRAGLHHAASSGLPEAERLWGDMQFQEGRNDEGMKWLLKAANADDSRAQQDLANRYAERYNASPIGQRNPEDRELSREWNTRAAQDGNVEVMLGLGYFYMNLPATKNSLREAQGWLQSASLAGNVEATLSLGDIYATNAPGLDGDASTAAKLYQAVLDEHPDNPNARLGLAELLVLGKGLAKDLQKARQLRADAAKTGNAAAEYVLGKDLLYGQSGSRNAQAGIAWLKKAAAQGYTMAKVDYADALFSGIGVTRDAQKAVQLWQAAFDEGTWTGANQGAWYLCTSTDPALLDPKRGMRFANELENVIGIGAAELDTVAACHAASNDFDGAIRVEQHAIREAEKMQPLPTKMIEALQKREQLYKQHKHYTEPFQ